MFNEGQDIYWDMFSLRIIYTYMSTCICEIFLICRNENKTAEHLEAHHARDKKNRKATLAIRTWGVCFGYNLLKLYIYFSIYLAVNRITDAMVLTTRYYLLAYD
ncbi:hypothetical protein ACJX0J_041085 [Zea mays]